MVEAPRPESIVPLASHANQLGDLCVLTIDSQGREPFCLVSSNVQLGPFRPPQQTSEESPKFRQTDRQ
ncbi:hypothetical protein ElyMa_006359200 [Elysia marginata]|uniref:Uncharacterized protein n=1 Tax=Elysia marginata TaxID=1093978 RepID=A0AAV4HML8_9GAST|nr:hypothetical protein ElyMa_006359200 [Elysia marginata]